MKKFAPIFNANTTAGRAVIAGFFVIHFTSILIQQFGSRMTPRRPANEPHRAILDWEIPINRWLRRLQREFPLILVSRYRNLLATNQHWELFGPNADYPVRRLIFYFSPTTLEQLGPTGHGPPPAGDLLPSGASILGESLPADFQSLGPLSGRWGSIREFFLYKTFTNVRGVTPRLAISRFAWDLLNSSNFRGRKGTIYGVLETFRPRRSFENSEVPGELNRKILFALDATSGP